MTLVHSERAASAVLRKEELHASLADPVLDTMNFLNEVTARYPHAISFAPGRPYEGFFEVEQVFAAVRRYLATSASRGAPRADPRRGFPVRPDERPDPRADRRFPAADEDIDVPAESIVVMVGAQDAPIWSAPCRRSARGAGGYGPST